MSLQMTAAAFNPQACRVVQSSRAPMFSRAPPPAPALQTDLDPEIPGLSRAHRFWAGSRYDCAKPVVFFSTRSQLSTYGHSVNTHFGTLSFPHAIRARIIAVVHVSGVLLRARRAASRSYLPSFRYRLARTTGAFLNASIISA